jgi:hypothetical protein
MELGSKLQRLLDKYCSEKDVLRRINLLIIFLQRGNIQKIAKSVAYLYKKHILNTKSALLMKQISKSKIETLN